MTTIKDVPLDSAVEEKIAWARRCYREIGDLLLADERVVVLLRELKDAINASRATMARSGVVNECRDCEENDGGSCCGIGLENKYTGTLLLINLLLERQIPQHRQYPSSCWFLGKQGCRLLARQVICVNYLCRRITDRIDPREIAVLREKEGVELERLFLLNERIKELCSGRS